MGLMAAIPKKKNKICIHTRKHKLKLKRECKKCRNFMKIMQWCVDLKPARAMPKGRSFFNTIFSKSALEQVQFVDLIKFQLY